MVSWKIDVHTHLIKNICGIGSEGELTPIGKGKALEEKIRKEIEEERAKEAETQAE